MTGIRQYASQLFGKQSDEYFSVWVTRKKKKKVSLMMSGRLHTQSWQNPINFAVLRYKTLFPYVVVENRPILLKRIFYTRSQCVGSPPSYDRWEVCTSHRYEQWRYRHGYNDHHLQHSSNWNSQWDPWQTSLEEKTLGHCRNSWSVRQKRELRKKRFGPEGSEKYKEVNNNMKKA